LGFTTRGEVIPVKEA